MTDDVKQRTRSRQRRASPASPSQTLPSPPAAEFAAKAKDLDALRTAVVDAAGVGAGLWFSYIFVLLYFFIAVSGVTHRDLLFESPIKLPILNVDLPLLGFFVLGPALLLIAHAYVLLHFVLLAGKVGAFDTELQAQIVDPDARARLRRQLPSNIFVQFLAGPSEVRTGIIGLMLRLIAQISLVAGPLMLLVFFQLQFLPYHHELITSWQRIALLADLALLWTLWPSVARGETARIAWRDFRRVRIVASALVSLALVLMVFTIATFPGESLDRNLPSVRFIPTKWPSSQKEGAAIEQGFLALLKSMGWSSLHEWLFAGEVDLVTGKPASLWSNRLVLPRLDVTQGPQFATEAKIAAPPAPLSLRGRQLDGAVLVAAHLRKADFTAAHLQDAVLNGADLREAHFGCEDSKAKKGVDDPLTGPDPDRSQSVRCVQLQGASLDGADLRGASLNGAHLEGAHLYYAQLQGATLNSAHLQGAHLDSAQLQGVSAVVADLRAASLTDAKLQGAWLSAASLEGARLWDAHLAGAYLDFAQLQGAALDGADLRGAWLTNASLQGAVIKGVQLQGANLDGIFVWRVNLEDANSEGAFVVAPDAEPTTAARFSALQRLVEETVQEGDQRTQALAQIQVLNPATAGGEADNAMAKAWSVLEQSSTSLNAYETRLATLWRKIGCEADDAPYVIHRWVRNLDSFFGSGSAQPAALAAAFLDETHCPAARKLSDEDKEVLRGIRDRLDRAIVNYNEAIQFDPKDAIAYYERGIAYKAKGDNDRAIADYTEAIQVDPRYAEAYFSRGLLLFYGGSLAQAQADLKQANELNPKYAYAALWYDIAERRNNIPSHLAETARQLDMRAWPAPVVRLFLGEWSPAQTLAAAHENNSETNRGQVCEANFYSGELALQQGAKDEAGRLFRRAVGDCPNGFVEWDAANQELKMLGIAR